MADETEKSAVIDPIDRKILRELLLNARISFRDLGIKINMSPNATAERVRKLMLSGIIRGFHADLDYGKLGQSLEAFIDVRVKPGTSAKMFEAAAMNLPGIRRINSITGSLDFRLLVACKDQADLVHLVETLRAKAGVQETYTSIILGEIVRWN